MEFSILRIYILCGSQINLGSASSSAVLSYSTITNTGSTVITGDIGTAGTAIIGFPPGNFTGNEFLSTQATLPLSDATAAYNSMNSYSGVDLSDQDLGSLILAPGTYTFSSSAQLTGVLTLLSTSSTNSFYIFKIGSSLTTAAGSSVVLQGTAKASNVFWQVGTSATFGADTQFVGTVLAGASITVGAGTRNEGGLFAFNDAVTLDTYVVNVAVYAMSSSEALSPISIVGGGDGGVGGVGSVMTTSAAVGEIALTSAVPSPEGLDPSHEDLGSVIPTISSRMISNLGEQPLANSQSPALDGLSYSAMETTSHNGDSLNDGAGGALGEIATSILNEGNVPSIDGIPTTTAPPQNKALSSTNQQTGNEIQSMITKETSTTQYLTMQDKISLTPPASSLQPNTGPQDIVLPDYITITSTIFTTLICTLQHYPTSSGTLQTYPSELTMPIEAMVEGGGGSTIVEIKVLTTTCTLKDVCADLTDLRKEGTSCRDIGGGEMTGSLGGGVESGMRTGSATSVPTKGVGCRSREGVGWVGWCCWVGGGAVCGD